MKSNQKAIECEECLNWFHVNCTAMSAQSYDNFGFDSKLVWICNRCAFPNFSTTFLLNNLATFTSNNSFQCLESNNSTTGSASYSRSPPMGPPLHTSSPITSSHSTKQTRRKLKIISLNCNGLKNPTNKVDFWALIDLHQRDIYMQIALLGPSDVIQHGGCFAFFTFPLYFSFFPRKFKVLLRKYTFQQLSM